MEGMEIQTYDSFKVNLSFQKRKNNGHVPSISNVFIFLL
jgi:hypothetical protein